MLQRSSARGEYWQIAARAGLPGKRGSCCLARMAASTLVPPGARDLFSFEVWVASLVSRKRSCAIEKFQLKLVRSPLRSWGGGVHLSKDGVWVYVRLIGASM